MAASPLSGNDMTDEDRKAIRTALRLRAEQAARRPDEAFARLVREGFYTAEGELTQQYGGPSETTGFAQLADERRPARATGKWPWEA